MSKEPELLIKASDLGDRLINCFETPLRLVPYSDVNLRTKVPKTPSWSPDSSLSETTTVQIEFRELSHLTGIKKYQVKLKTFDYYVNHNSILGNVFSDLAIHTQLYC